MSNANENVGVNSVIISDNSSDPQTSLKTCIEVETQQGMTYCEVYGKEHLTDEVLPVSNIILIVHGLGGTVENWEASGIAPYLAAHNKVVVCFDWYSHGKSATLDATHVKHDVDLFINQLHEVINSKELPIKGRNFCLHGFSMGCYLVANYVTEYRDVNIDKLVLQSPWSGEVPGIVRFLIQIPFFVRLFRPKYLSGIKSITTLKQILLELGAHRPWTDILNELSQNDRPATILLIASEKDPKLIRDAATEFQLKMGKNRSTMSTTPKAGHLSFVNRATVSDHLKKELVEFYSLTGLPGEGRISVILSADDRDLTEYGEIEESEKSMPCTEGKLNETTCASRTVSQADEIIQSETDGSFYVNNKKYI